MLSSGYMRFPSVPEKGNLYRNNRAVCEAAVVRTVLLKNTFTGQHSEKQSKTICSSVLNMFLKRSENKQTKAQLSCHNNCLFCNKKIPVAKKVKLLLKN